MNEPDTPHGIEVTLLLVPEFATGPGDKPILEKLITLPLTVETFLDFQNGNGGEKTCIIDAGPGLGRIEFTKREIRKSETPNMAACTVCRMLSFERLNDQSLLETLLSNDWEIRNPDLIDGQTWPFTQAMMAIKQTAGAAAS